MKTNKLFIILLFVFCRCAQDKNKIADETVCDGSIFPEVNDKYVYPIVPGMVEWQTAEDFDEIISFCQLPENILKTISTPGLIDALIHAPMFTGQIAISSGTEFQTWQRIYGQFNSANELFMRKDAGNALVAYCKLVCFDCILDESIACYIERERIRGLEFLFTKQEILNTTEHAQKKETVSLLLSNYEQCPDNTLRVFPMAFIMLADKYAPIVKYYDDKPEVIQSLLNGFGHPSTPNQWDIIISFANDYINN